MSSPIIIFTDGAARRNPGPGGWGAIIALPDGRVEELGAADPATTNNKMEMTGAIVALERIAGVTGPAVLYTDSSYLIQGITQWIHGWRRKGWVTSGGQPVLNRDLWERLSALVAQRGAAGRVAWKHVRGHAGIPGNERCDEIATGLADGHAVELYVGPRAEYPVDLDDVGADAAAAKPAVRRGKPASPGGSGPVRYLSLVGGRLERHRTWAECESRVRGVSGAKFKKATGAEDEAAIARGWGVAPPEE